MKQKLVVCALAVSVAYVAPVVGVVYGSESSVSVESLAYFPSSDTNNAMVGFGWFKNGFSFQDQLTTCTFSALYPVQGIVDTAGGTLVLRNHLRLDTIVDVRNLGRVEGNGYSVEFPSAPITLSAPVTFNNATVVLYADLVLQSDMRIEGVCFIDGVSNNQIIFAGGSITIADGAQLYVNGILLKNLIDGSIRAQSADSQIVLDGVICSLAADIHFTLGSLVVNNTCVIQGAGCFYLDTTATSTINQRSLLVVQDHATLLFQRDSVTGREPFYFSDTSAALVVDGAAIHIGAQGACLTHGALVCKNAVDILMSSTLVEHGLQIGDGISEDNDFIIELSAGVSVALQGGQFVYNNVASNAMYAASTSSTLIRKQGSYLTLLTPLLLDGITVVEEPYVQSAHIVGDAYFRARQAEFLLPYVRYGLMGDLLGDDSIQLATDQGVYMLSGLFPFVLRVQGSGNTLWGSGNCASQILLSDTASQLLVGLEGSLTGSMSLADGCVELLSDMYVSQGFDFVSSGTLVMHDNTLYLGGINRSLDVDLTIVAQAGAIEFSGTLYVNKALAIYGDVSINAMGGTIVLGQQGSICIYNGATLTLQNVMVNGVVDDNICCFDDSGTIALANSGFMLTGDYVFIHGALRVAQGVNVVKGGHMFAYESNVASLIAAGATLKIAGSTTLQMGNNPTTHQACMQFQDQSAVLQFNNADLQTTGQGLTLMGGAFECVGNVTVDVASTSTTNALIFGDGTVLGDIAIRLAPGSRTNFVHGHVVLNNSDTADHAILSTSNTAIMARADNSVFYLNNNLTLSLLTLEISPYAQLYIKDGKQLYYDADTVKILGSSFQVTGARYNNETILLDHDGQLMISEGVLPLAVRIENTGATLAGGGSVGGPLFFADEHAECTTMVSGLFKNSCVLNGGTLALGSDMRIDVNGVIEGPGTLLLQGNSCLFARQEVSMDSPLTVQGSGTLVYRDRCVIDAVIKIEGNVTIDCGGNALVFGASGGIVIAAGATLTIKNGALLDVATESLQVLDDTATCIFMDLDIYQKDDVSWEQGALVVAGSVNMYGGHTYRLVSSSATTVLDNARWTFNGRDTTLEYAPSSGALDLLVLSSASARLCFFNGSFVNSVDRVLFTGGTIIVSGLVDFNAGAVGDGSGIWFGTGIAAGDCMLEVAPGSTFTLATGTLQYAITNSSLLSMGNSLSTIYIDQDAACVVHTPINLGIGRLHLAANAVLQVQDDASIQGSIFR